MFATDWYHWHRKLRLSRRCDGERIFYIYIACLSGRHSALSEFYVCAVCLFATASNLAGRPAAADITSDLNPNGAQSTWP